MSYHNDANGSETKENKYKTGLKIFNQTKKIEFTTYTLFITNLLADTINKTLQ